MIKSCIFSFSSKNEKFVNTPVSKRAIIPLPPPSPSITDPLRIKMMMTKRYVMKVLLKKPTAKGEGLRMADSHTGKDPIGLAKVTPERSGEEISFRNFIYIEEDEGLTFLPKDLSLGFNTGSPFVSINIKPVRTDEEPVTEPVNECVGTIADSVGSPKGDTFVVHTRSVAAHIRERKCKTRGGSSRPLVKRKLASGLKDCLELKDATAYHLKISAITPPAWKGFLDNHLDVDLLEFHDCCYTRQAIMDNAVNRRSRKLLEESAEVKEHKGNLDTLMLESQKWSGYQEIKEAKHDRREVVSKVVPYACMKLIHSDELGRRIGKALIPLPLPHFSLLNEYVADASASIEALLSKKPPTLQKPVPSRTQIHVPSTQQATPSSVPSLKTHVSSY
ncbi:hypothetical protein Tco_0481764 [Tanacetum coccineum]